MIYRLATENDLTELAAMRWDFITENHPQVPPGVSPETFRAAFTDFLREGLASGRWTAWVAEEDGQILSHMYIQRVRKMPHPGRWLREFGYVSNVYTRPAYRNRGIGAALMKCVQQWGREQKLESLLLRPSRRSVPFYRRAGFHPPSESLEFIFEED